MTDHKDRAHALLSASGASRWLNCNPSAKLEETIADGVESEAAREGTFAHEYAELKIRNQLDPVDKSISRQLVEKRKHPLYSKELNDHVNTYMAYVIERFNKAKAANPKAVLLIEEKLDLREFVPEGFGTGDAGIISGDELEIIDLKFGRARVEAENNDQLGIYALGYLAKYDIIYDIKKVTRTIIQPRLDHQSSETLETEELYLWGDMTVKPTAQIAFKGEGELRPGSWCKFCKVKPTCKALRDFSVNEMKKDFSKAVPKDSDSDKVLNVAEIAHAFKSVKLVEDWIASVKKYVLEKALSGTNFPDLKLVRGKANRRWIDEGKAINIILDQNDAIERDQVVNEKIKGIGDIEKLIGKKELEELNLLVKPLGAPTVVDSSDKRPEYEGRKSLEEDFEQDIEIDF